MHNLNIENYAVFGGYSKDFKPGAQHLRWETPPKRQGLEPEYIGVFATKMIQNIRVSEVKSLSRVGLFTTPWTVAYQAPPFMGFSRQEYWSRLAFPSPGDLPNPGNLGLSNCRQTLPSEPPRKPKNLRRLLLIIENQIPQLRNLALFCVWKNASLGSLKPFLWYAPQLSGASITCFSPPWIPSGYTVGRRCTDEGLAVGSPSVFILSSLGAHWWGQQL